MQIEIEALMNKTDENDVFVNIVYNLMTHYNQQYSEIMKMPLPLVWKLLKIAKQENDKMEAEMRRKK